MELIMPKEELRNIKEKVVFWFWCVLISYVVLFLIGHFKNPLQIYFSINIGQQVGYLIYKTIDFLIGIIFLLFCYSVIMFLIRCSKYFIEKEN